MANASNPTMSPRAAGVAEEVDPHYTEKSARKWEMSSIGKKWHKNAYARNIINPLENTPLVLHVTNNKDTWDLNACYNLTSQLTKNNSSSFANSIILHLTVFQCFPSEKLNWILVGPVIKLIILLIWNLNATGQECYINFTLTNTCVPQYTVPNLLV